MAENWCVCDKPKTHLLPGIIFLIRAEKHSQNHHKASCFLSHIPNTTALWSHLLLKYFHQPTEKHGIQKGSSNSDFDKAVQLQKDVETAGQIVRNNPELFWSNLWCLPGMDSKAKGSTSCPDQISKTGLEPAGNAVREGTATSTTTKTPVL